MQRILPLLFCALLVAACEGPMGPPGPAGPVGPAGDPANVNRADATGQLGSSGSFTAILPSVATNAVW